MNCSRSETTLFVVLEDDCVDLDVRAFIGRVIDCISKYVSLPRLAISSSEFDLRIKEVYIADNENGTNRYVHVLL